MWLDLGEYRGPSRFHAFVMFSLARYKRRMESAAYRTYVADSLYAIPQGMGMSHRLSDLTRPKQEIDVDAIIEHVTELVEA